MLNRSQIQTLLMVRYYGSKNFDSPAASMFSQIPWEIIQEISQWGQNPDSDFDKAIKHVARGELLKVKSILGDASIQENKTTLKELLLSSGTVVTCCGILVKHKTLLECALGDGDLEMIGMIQSYFSKFQGGEKERERQLERYRPCIKKLENQKPSDLTQLFEIIKKASAKDVFEELKTGDKYDSSYRSALREAMNQFRGEKLDPKVRVITQPLMHCNYQNLIHAYDLLNVNWGELLEWDDVKQDFNKCKRTLIEWQVIGLIQLVELPAYERYIFSRDQTDKAIQGQDIERLFNFKYCPGSFPEFDSSRIHSRYGLGFTSSIYASSAWAERYKVANGDYKTYVKQKTENLLKLYEGAQLASENASVYSL